LSKIIYVTGGARSGKSAYAQEVAEQYTDVAYIATAEAGDSEMQERILLHQQSRPQTWATIEASANLPEAYKQTKHEFYLLDCMTVYISNKICAAVPDEDAEIIDMAVQNKVEQQVLAELADITQTIRSHDLTALFVTNEVGMGLVPAYPMGRMFRDVVGRANKYMAAAADEAWLIVSGIPMKLK
jgi:adenosylcobinamide kinase / adenosylcobinamide-phosphate guanylyltransferase